MSLKYFADQGEKLVGAVKAAGPIPGAIGFTLNNIRDLDARLTTVTKKPTTAFWNPYVSKPTQTVYAPVPLSSKLLPGKFIDTVIKVIDDPGSITQEVRKLKPLTSVVGIGADSFDDPFRGVGQQPNWIGLTRMLAGVHSHGKKIKRHRL